MNLTVAFVTLSSLTIASSVLLQCAFQTSGKTYYACTNIKLVIKNSKTAITKVSGGHQKGKSNKDVTVVYFLSSAMKRLPIEVFQFFPNLSRYVVQGIDLNGKYLSDLTEGDFKGAQGLNAIVITGVNLKKIKPRVFVGASNLQFLSMEACGLSEISGKSFRGLEKLETLSMNYNLIRSLNNDTFEHLGNLKTLSMSGNYIQVLRQELFLPVSKLSKISFVSNLLEVVNPNVTLIVKDKNLTIFMKNNICVHKNFGGNNTPLGEFPRGISNCTRKMSLRGQIKGLKKDVRGITITIEKMAKEIREIHANLDLAVEGGFLKQEVIDELMQHSERDPERRLLIAEISVPNVSRLTTKPPIKSAKTTPWKNLIVVGNMKLESSDQSIAKT